MEITSEKSKWVWDSTQQRAFVEIRNTIACQVLLKCHDFSTPFDVYTDALDYQLGAVNNQNNWLIFVYSRKLNSAQRNYTTMEKELLSIIETSQQYRHVILGNRCTFYCVICGLQRIKGNL